MRSQPLHEFGGQGPVLHLAVANGFPPQTYSPLLVPLTERFRVVSLPPRPLWPDPPPPAGVHSWSSIAGDLLAGLAQHQLRDVIGVGHSLGSIISLLAAVEASGCFRAVILLDPPLLPPWFLLGARLLQAVGLGGRLPLVQGALRRRHRFASHDEAFNYWRGKPLFHDWPDAALRLYVESMLRPAANGDGLELAWSREWEAQLYRTLYTRPWSLLKRIPAGLPVLAIRGATSHIFTAASARAFCRVLPGAELVEIEGAGHLFPHTAPDATRDAIVRWLHERGLSSS
ncbi:MAG: alpha/beta hydrolase [Chloroflexota bacterium]